MNHRIWLEQPAKIWEEAFPVGNGELGAMVFGDYKRERIALNIDTLWSGYGKRKTKIGSAPILTQIQKEIIAHRPAKAEELMKDKFLNEWNESYLPLGNLYFELENGGSITEYKRELLLKEGIAVTSYKVKDNRIRVETFVPAFEKAIVVQIKSDKNIKLKLWMDTPLKHQVEISNSAISFFGNAPSKVQPNYYECEDPIVYSEETPGMAYFCIARIMASSAKIRQDEKALLVEAGKTVSIMISASTAYNRENGKITYSLEEIRQQTISAMERITKEEEFALLEKHKQEFSGIYNRVQLSLTEREYDRPSNKLLEEFSKSQTQAELMELMFNFGRYLLISSSRPGTMAANLQGIWNDKLRAPWSSNYTTNINTQMNYWLAEKSNLSEMHLPLFQLLKNCMDSGRQTAKEQFNCRGWVANHNIDCWHHTGPVGNLAKRPSVKYGFFPGASGWLCFHIWEHYLYTKDIEFLSEFYPVMKEAVLFYIDFMQVIDGKYEIVPSVSPENLYYNDRGEECALSISTTADISIIKMLLKSTIEAANELNMDEGFCEELQTILLQMPEYKISQAGYLQEWKEDYKEVYPTHRHISHLIGLYPGYEFESRPKLQNACYQTLKRRTMEGTAWCKVWKSCCYSRLKKREEAYQQLCGFLSPMKSTEIEYLESGCQDNLLCTPPFQIDGNLGIVAAILEMLIQDKKGVVELLPACPNEWPKGKIRGVKIKGNHTIDFEWRESRIVEVTIKGGCEEELIVIFNEEKRVYLMEKDRILNIYAEK
ncbi:MAG: glycoside hydrolase family 95 protein [Eubacteriales bacterium]|nr:glycoside hydrolase family 95 protein [Eubacteriales bacterium]